MPSSSLIGLDIGLKRIGVARVSLDAKLPEALGTYENDESFFARLKELIDEYQVDSLIVGLPRNMDGQETAQSALVRDFCDSALKQYDMPIIMQDETLSSVEAEQRLKPNQGKKSDIDTMSAVIILEDYLKTV